MSKKPKQTEEPPPPPLFDPTVMVILVSGDGHEFYVDRNCAKISNLLKQCLLVWQTSGKEAAAPIPEITLGDSSSGHPRITLPFTTQHHLDRIIQFMHYKYRFDADPDKRVPFALGETPEERTELLSLATLLQC